MRIWKTMVEPDTLQMTIS